VTRSESRPSSGRAGALGYLGFLFYRLGEAVAVRVPMDVAYRIAEKVAWLFWVFHRRSRNILVTNLRYALGPNADEATVQRTARAGFNQFAYGVVDFFRQPRLMQGELDELMVSVSGEEYLQDAMTSGRGGILMIAHMGPWEAGGVWVAKRGIPVTGVALTHESPQLERFFLTRRERSGYRTVPLGQAARELLRTLKKGQMIVVAADRNFDEFGSRVEFFGHPAVMPDGHVRIALRTGAPIIPAWLERTEDLRAHIIFEPPIFLKKGRDNVRSGLRQCLDLLESRIRRRPEQWMAFSPIWVEE
jgi:KDO2-lipid IV(A) lauroyltransferase